MIQTLQNGILSLRRRYAAFRARKIVRGTTDFLYSPIFVYAVGLVTLLLYVLGNEALGLCVTALFGCVVFLLCPDALPALPLVSMFFLVRSDPAHAFVHEGTAVAAVSVCAGLAALAFLWHLLVNFSPRAFFGSRLAWSFAALEAGMALGGFFFSDYTWKSWVYTGKIMFYVIGIYVLVRACIRPEKESLRYFAHVGIMFSLVLGAEVCLFYITDKTFIEAGYPKALLVLGFGISNEIAEGLFRAIPLCFYLMCTEKKHAWLYFAVASVILISIIFTYARATLLFAVPLYAVSYVLCLLFGKNRKQTVLCGLIALAAAGVLFLALRGKLDTVLAFFKESGFNDRGRFPLWNQGVHDFLSYPIFGVGTERLLTTMGHRCYHNTLVQFLATGGCVGIGTYLFHRMRVAELFTQKPTRERLFLAVMAGGTLLISLLDCFYFAFSSQVFMAFALVYAEADLNRALPFAYRRRKKGQMLG